MPERTHERQARAVTHARHQQVVAGKESAPRARGHHGKLCRDELPYKQKQNTCNGKSDNYPQYSFLHCRHNCCNAAAPFPDGL